MKVLDLFSGLGGFSQAFVDRGHEVHRWDIDPSFNPDRCVDIFDVHRLPKADIILAGVPCEKFSIMGFGHNWNPGYLPKNEETRQAIALAFKTKRLIQNAHPRSWIMENPVGLLRVMLGPPKTTITQCQYGSKHMKPTDLWGELPDGFSPRRCKNGAECHVRSPRGSRNGVNGNMSRAERAKLPYGLSLELCQAMENLS